MNNAITGASSSRGVVLVLKRSKPLFCTQKRQAKQKKVRCLLVAQSVKVSPHDATVFHATLLS